ncbi:RING finger ubiquitin E3 ligase [Quillaja saponaria]|uniref:RING-type E3 ubiquitin transferase n=1 Tax=Quillaja saponaria TaxID=32244 RepID=A0AAD7P6V6_QUISA|nr:RING finger ubiquitin E3 ligase [Quillaja saponaria]
MILRNLVSIIFKFIGIADEPRSKEAPSLCHVNNVIHSDVLQKIEQQSSTLVENIEVDLCCVCLSMLKEEDDDMRVLPCFHKFHKHCVDRWFHGCRRTCPLCRLSVGGAEKSCRTEVLTDEMVHRNGATWSLS